MPELTIPKTMRRWAAILGLLAAQGGAAAQEPSPHAPDTAVTTSRETYRIRLENTQFGRIEISVDGGEHFALIGRVLKPAVAPSADREVTQPGTVVRSGGDGIAFGVAPGESFKILPAGDAAVRAKGAKSALLTDLNARVGPFGELLPPIGTAVLQQLGRAPWKPLPSGLAATDETVFALIVTIPAIHGPDPAGAPADAKLLSKLAEARKRLTDMSDQYASSALARAKEAKRSVVSGTVLLRAKLPAGEPEPIMAVRYSIDGDIVSDQTLMPSTYGWDTTTAQNGEHVIEVRALSKYATVVTRLRMLVVVNNPSAGSTSIDKPVPMQ